MAGLLWILATRNQKLQSAKPEPEPPLPSAREVVANLQEDVRKAIENFLKSKCEIERLSEGDIPVIAILSKFSSTHWDTVAEYIRAGFQFGRAASYVGIAGRCVGLEDLLQDLQKCETEYAKAGFVPISIELFANWAGWGNNRKVIDEMGVPNPNLDPVVLYTAVYISSFMGHDYPMNNALADAFETGQPSMGNYAQPSPDKALGNMSPDGQSRVMYDPKGSNQA